MFAVGSGDLARTSQAGGGDVKYILRRTATTPCVDRRRMTTRFLVSARSRIRNQLLSATLVDLTFGAFESYVNCCDIAWR